MKALLITILSTLLITPAYAADKPTRSQCEAQFHASNASQHEFRGYMAKCLRGSTTNAPVATTPAHSEPVVTQKDKMSHCASEFYTQHISQHEYRGFMAKCMK